MTVVFDLLAGQRRQGGTSRAAQLTTRVAEALASPAAAPVDTWTVRRERPQPAIVAEVAATGRLAVTTPRARPRPGDGGVFVTGALFAPDAEPAEIIPRRFDGPAWRRVALVDESAMGIGTGMALDEDRRRIVDGIDRFLVATAAVADHLTALGVDPAAVAVTGVGIDPVWRPDPRDHEVVVSENHQAPPAPGVRARHVLVPYGRGGAGGGGGALHRVIEAHATLSPEARAVHQLVVVGVPSDGVAASLLDTAARAGLVPGDVCPVGHVDAATRRRLVSGAHLVVIAEVGDGVAVTLREALAAAVPVVAIDHPAHAGLLPASQVLDPAHPAGYVDHVATRPAPAAVPADNRTWADVAAAIADEVSALPAPRAPEPSRPRIALVTPAPGQSSGIADYAAGLLGPLAADASVTVFADRVTDTRPMAGVRLEPTVRFDAIDASERFHHVVTFLGNSAHHVDALDVVRRHGGTVVLHDARLAALYSAAVDDDPDRVWGGRVGAVLERWYPGRYGDDVTAMAVIDPGTAAARGVDLLAEVAACADDVVVHSEVAADTMWRDTGRRPDVAFGLPFDEPLPKAARDGHRQDLHLVTMGGITPVKQPELLVDALAALRRTHPATLTFCGGSDEAQVAHLRAHVAAAGLDDAVTITGRVDADEYRRTVASATVAVQLRAFTNGESSAALHDAIAAGVPTVATRVGSLAAYPDDVVVTVSPHAGPDELAGVLADLLDDEARRREMEDAARRLAGACSYRSVARALLDRLAAGAGDRG